MAAFIGFGKSRRMFLELFLYEGRTLLQKINHPEPAFPFQLEFCCSIFPQLFPSILAVLADILSFFRPIEALTARSAGPSPMPVTSIILSTARSNQFDQWALGYFSAK